MTEFWAAFALFSIFLIPVLLGIFLSELLNSSGVDKFLWIPVKFAVKEVNRGGLTEYKLYYKRLLFWYPYKIGIGPGVETYYIGSMERIEIEIERVLEWRDEKKVFNRSNRKNKIKEI